MAVSTGALLKGFHDTAVAIGAKIISSDFTLEIAGFESMYLLTKQCPWPVLTPGEGIEIPTVLGAAMWQPGQAKFNQQGAITFGETVAGSVDNMLAKMLIGGGEFNAKIYEGTPTNYLRYKVIKKCFINCEPPDRDWENRTQPLLITGNIFFHYYGEVVEGNSKDYS